MILASLADRPVNLPSPLTPLVGRRREGATVAALLARPEVRLLTLTGPGGVGKTRLATEVGASVASKSFPGVVFVPLAPIREATLVIPTIAQALGLRHDGDRSLGEQLAVALGDRPLLMVLDNFEHVLDAAPVVSELLVPCPSLTVLTTSRSLLRISGEHAYVVPPLALPAPDRLSTPDELAQTEAVALFVARSRAADPDFALTAANAPSVAAICAQLDGLPLAIELAAARIRVFTADTLLARLSEPLRLLTGGARDQPPRLRTMRDAVAWSHDLLTGQEQTLFRRLAVFDGGCTLEAAEAVCGEPGLDVVDGMSALVEQSLIQRRDPAGTAPRFTMLETVRAFALEQLAASSEEAVVRSAHAAYVLGLVERHDPWGTDRELQQIAAEYDNVRGALAWLLEHGERNVAAQLATKLVGFWYLRGHFSEGRQWLARVLSEPDDIPIFTHARALFGAGQLAAQQGDLDEADPLITSAIVGFREVGEDGWLAVALNHLGNVALSADDLDRAQTVCEEALDYAHRSGHPQIIADPVINLGRVALARGDYAQAEPLLEEGTALKRAAGAVWGSAVGLLFLGMATRARGDYLQALVHLRSALDLLRAYADPATIARCLEVIAGVLIDRGQANRGVPLLGFTEGLRERIAHPIDAEDRQFHVATVAAAREALSNATFTAAWAAGRALSLDDALAVALAADEDETTRLPATPAPHGLTPRELEVLRLIADGLSNRQIGTRLSLSERTVENHVLHVLTKLNLASRSAATAYAIRHGLA